MHLAGQMDSSLHQCGWVLAGASPTPLGSADTRDWVLFISFQEGTEGGSGEDRQGGMETYMDEVRLSGLGLT